MTSLQHVRLEKKLELPVEWLKVMLESKVTADSSEARAEAVIENRRKYEPCRTACTSEFEHPPDQAARFGRQLPYEHETRCSRNFACRV